LRKRFPFTRVAKSALSTLAIGAGEKNSFPLNDDKLRPLPTHTEHLSKGEIEDVENAIATVNPHAKRVTAIRLTNSLVSSIDQEEMQMESVSHGKHSSHHDHAHQLSHRFTGCQIPLPGQYRGDQIKRFLEALPPEVVRAKALVKLKESLGSRWLTLAHAGSRWLTLAHAGSSSGPVAIR
jgi:G3E family GTPase